MASEDIHAKDSTLLGSIFSIPRDVIASMNSDLKDSGGDRREVPNPVVVDSSDDSVPNINRLPSGYQWVFDLLEKQNLDQADISAIIIYLDAEAICNLKDAILIHQQKIFDLPTAQKYGVKTGVFSKFIASLMSSMEPDIKHEEVSWQLFMRRLSSMRFFSNPTFLSRILYPFQILFNMITGRWYWKSLSNHVGYDAELIHDRLIGEWSTMALVSSLGLTFAFPTIFAAPLQNPYELQLGGLDATVAVPIMVVVCIGLLMLSLVSAILLIMSITTLPKNFAGEFIYEFRLYITIPEITVVSGMFIYCIACLLAGYTQYGTVFWEFSLVIILWCLAFVWFFWWTLINILDRKGGLWQVASEIASVVDEGEPSKLKSSHSSISLINLDSNMPGVPPEGVSKQ